MKCEGQKESYRSRGWNAMRPDTAVTWRSCSCCLDSQAWGAGLTTWTLSMPIVSLHLTLSPVSLFNHFPLKRWNSKLLENHFRILSLTRMIFYALLMLARQLRAFCSYVIRKEFCIFRAISVTLQNSWFFWAPAALLLNYSFFTPNTPNVFKQELLYGFHMQEYLPFDKYLKPPVILEY